MGQFFNQPIENDHKQNINYSHLSNDELFNQFKTEQWHQLETKEQKIALLQEVENRIAAVNGREPSTVQEITDPTLLGSYNGYTHTISIRLDDNPYENLDSVIHEAQHANHRYSSTNISGLDQKDRAIISLEHYPSENGKESFYAYYQHHHGNDLYDIYHSELDANNTAFSVLFSQRERYEDDVNYQAYLEGRNAHFESVNTKLNSMSDEKKEAILHTADYNFMHHYISKEQYQMIHANLQDENSMSSIEKTAIYHHETLSELMSQSTKENDFGNEFSDETDTTVLTDHALRNSSEMTDESFVSGNEDDFDLSDEMTTTDFTGNDKSSENDNENEID